MQVHLQLDWKLIWTIVGAIIGLIGGVRSANRFKENWSPATRYRELRLLRSRESKAREMNSASCYRIKEAFASSVEYDDCKLEQYRFARELNNPRKNVKLAEESASLPGTSLFEFVLALALFMLFFAGVAVLSRVLRQWPLVLFVLVVLAWSCLLTLVWALLTQASKQYCWNEAIKYGFDNFLKPVFQETGVCYDRQDEFKKAIRSFHTVYDDATILSLGKTISRLFFRGAILLFVALLIDTALDDRFHWNPLWSHPVSLAVTAIVGVLPLCCYLTYSSELQKLIQNEKKQYPWYNPLIDKDDGLHFKGSNIIFEFGYWLGETFGKPKKRKGRNE